MQKVSRSRARRGGISQAFGTLFVRVLNTVFTNRNNRTFRIRFDVGGYEAGLGLGTQVRVTFRGHPTNELAIRDAHIHRHGGSNVDFETTPLPLTFAGETARILAPDEELLSDPVVLTVDPTTDALVVSFFVDPDTARDDLATDDNSPNTSTFFRTGNNASAINAGAQSLLTHALAAVEKIEIRP